MDKIKELMNKIDNLSIRERGIILAAILFVMYSAWDSVLMRPLSVTEKRVTAELNQKQADRMTLNTTLQQLVTRRGDDPDLQNKQRLSELKQQLKQIETEITSSTRHLVAPESMAKILETILLKTGGLELIELKGLGAQSLLSETDEEKQGSEQVTSKPDPGNGLENAYKHGLKISFEGDYLSTLAYVRELESLEWGFFWDQLEFEVVEYPEAKASITVFTLSLDKNWIGV